MAVQRGKLYTYLAIYHPRETKDAGGNDITEKSKLIIPPTDILATSEKIVATTASRQIPDEYADKLEEVEVLIRPFS